MSARQSQESYRDRLRMRAQDDRDFTDTLDGSKRTHLVRRTNTHLSRA